MLITGACARRSPRRPSPSARLQFDLRHRSRRLDLSIYDKVHLVPFGEYLPFQKLWSGRPAAAHQGAGRIHSGDRRRRSSCRGRRAFVPLICYEVIFPARRCRAATGRAGSSISPMTAGSVYHRALPAFQQARLRAIEEGLPLVRAANTGISAVVDPVGRVVESLPLADRGRPRRAAAAGARRTPYFALGRRPGRPCARRGVHSGPCNGVARADLATVGQVATGGSTMPQTGHRLGD